MVSDAESHPRGAAIKRVRLKSARNADSGLFLGTAMRGFLNQGIYCRVERSADEAVTVATTVSCLLCPSGWASSD